MAKCTGRVPEKDDDGNVRRDNAGKRITRPCKASAVTGTNVCRMHGGSAKQVRAKAQRVTAEQQAAQRLGRLAAVLGPADPVENPLTALSALAGEVLRFKDLLAGQVAELNTLRYEGKAGEQVRAELLLFERALDRCNTVLGNIARLNIDERLAAISERQAERVIAAIDAALDEADVPDDRRTTARRAAARHLRAV